MSTSLLYHAFGLKGVKYQATDYEGDKIVFRIYQEPKRQRCPACGSRDLVRRGCVWREFRGIPIGRKKVVIRLPAPSALPDVWRPAAGEGGVCLRQAPLHPGV